MAPEANGTKPVARASVWLDRRQSARVRRSDRPDQPPGLDRDRITRESVRLLDAEGQERFSMRRLAAELGVTAMSLYWYVDTKDDLLELAADAVFGEIETDSTSSDWRDQLSELAVSYRSVLVRHPWVTPLIGKYLNIGPCSAAFLSKVKDVARRTGLSPDGQKGVTAAVFQFVYGFGTIEGHYAQRCAEAGLSEDEYYRQALEARGHQAAPVAVEAMRERDFTFALDLLVAGIEAMRARSA